MCVSNDGELNEITLTLSSVDKQIKIISSSKKSFLFEKATSLCSHFLRNLL